MKKLIIRIPQDRDRLYTLIRYPAGEIQVRLTMEGIKACYDNNVYEILANPIPDFIELAQLKDALEKVGEFATTILNLPYLPYARADRRFVHGDCFGLGVYADLINALQFDRVYAHDVHSRVAKRLINNLVDTFYSNEEILHALADIGLNGSVLIAPDEGAAERYNIKNLGRPVVQGLKHREASSGRLSGFGFVPEHESYLKGASKALMVDDICDGGGTFIGLAQAAHAINPKLDLYLHVSHGIFSKGQEELLKHFKKIFASRHGFNAEKA